MNLQHTTVSEDATLSRARDLAKEIPLLDDLIAICVKLDGKVDEAHDEAVREEVRLNGEIDDLRT